MTTSSPSQPVRPTPRTRTMAAVGGTLLWALAQAWAVSPVAKYDVQDDEPLYVGFADAQTVLAVTYGGTVSAWHIGNANPVRCFRISDFSWMTQWVIYDAAGSLIVCTPPDGVGGGWSSACYDLLGERTAQTSYELPWRGKTVIGFSGHAIVYMCQYWPQVRAATIDDGATRNIIDLQESGSWPTPGEAEYLTYAGLTRVCVAGENLLRVVGVDGFSANVDTRELTAELGPRWRASFRLDSRRLPYRVSQADPDAVDSSWVPVFVYSAEHASVWLLLDADGSVVWKQPGEYNQFKGMTRARGGQAVIWSEGKETIVFRPALTGVEPQRLGVSLLESDVWVSAEDPLIVTLPALQVTYGDDDAFVQRRHRVSRMARVIDLEKGTVVWEFPMESVLNGPGVKPSTKQ